MLQSVEAIVEPSGVVRLLESFRVDHPCRAVVTLLEAPSQAVADTGPVQEDLLSFLDRTRLAPEARLDAREIEEQVEAARSAWD